MVQAKTNIMHKSYLQIQCTHLLSDRVIEFLFSRAKDGALVEKRGQRAQQINRH
jgi:hypothetical protein